MGLTLETGGMGDRQMSMGLRKSLTQKRFAALFCSPSSISVHQTMALGGMTRWMKWQRIK